ncbi:MAG TPA: tetratricopeptide repeat protein [Nitrososphaeraceae archaeon]|nr:tetratricopeptide repeat protein [Nitrososphaeraceae archaeon]
MISQDLLSFVYSEEKEREQMATLYKDEILCDKSQKWLKFCEELSKRWINDIIESMSDNKTTNEEITRKEKEKFMNFHNEHFNENDCNSECDILIYSYFLYLCGALFLFKQEKDLEHLETLKNFFKSKSQNLEYSNNRLFFKFMDLYVDIVNPRVPDMTVFEEVKQCLTNDDDNFLFDAIEIEHKIMQEIIRKTPGRTIKRKEKINQIFPNFEKKYKTIETNIIESVMQSGLARLYFVAGRDDEHEKRLDAALNDKEGFPENSYAIVQKAHLLLKQRHHEDDEDGNTGDLDKTERKPKDTNAVDTAERKLKKVIELIDDYDQFGKIEDHNPLDNIDDRIYFKHRIKLEAIAGLAYIDYIRGQYRKADKKYEEAEKLVDNYLGTENIYLKSIISLNRGRNHLDNGFDENNGDAIRCFRKVLKIYNDPAQKEMKEELTEVAALAHNNLGVCYLNEGRYEEAEEQLKKALELDDTSSHVRYNLGVLYHRKGDEARAITLIRNAHNLDTKFLESKKALEKLGAIQKRQGLGAEWFDWWFRSAEKGTKAKTKKRNTRLLWLKRAIAIVLISIIITAVGKLALDLYLHDFVNMGNMTSGTYSSIHTHDPDETAFLVVVAIGITILMLPFINKLRIGEVEIEVESAGYRPVGPASVTMGLSANPTQYIRYPFFYARFWY